MLPFLYMRITYTRSGLVNEVIIGAACPGDVASGIAEYRHQNINGDPLGVVRLHFHLFPHKPVYNFDI